MVRDLLADAERQDLVEPAMLLVSEVVTNALLHAGTPIDVSATLEPEGLRVEVRDGSAHAPVRRRYAPTSGTGRGLMLLEELVDDWGISRHDEGKTVWFRLCGTSDQAPSPDPPRTAESRGRAREPAAVEIELRNMPLLLHGAWQEHAEALLREYLLSHLDGDLAEEAIQVHAEATDAIAVLEEHVPLADVGMQPDQLMENATEPRVSADVRVPVPLRSVGSFATLDSAIEHALSLSRTGRVLTPPTQPEIRAFRRWLCEQVRGQAAGDEPAPWSMETAPPAQPQLDLDWDVTDVERASVAKIAADEANRIVAVSSPALDLLGYDDPAQLVGKRIVAIIPDRFRQAHIAGFTLFLLVGRGPLIDTDVVVPARRRDGSEVETRMTVTVQPAGDGLTVFVAELRPVDD